MIALLSTLSALASAANITLIDPDACLDPAALQSALTSIDADLAVQVSPLTAESATIDLLATSRDGRTWSREMAIAAADCPLLAPVIARSVEQGLADMPELPGPDPVVLEREAELRSYRVFFALPTVAMGWSADTGSTTDISSRFGMQWDSGVTLSLGSSWRPGGEEVHFKQVVQIGWMLPGERFTPELSAAIGGGLTDDPAASLSLWMPFTYPIKSGDMLVGPTITAEEPFDGDGLRSTQLFIGAALVIRGERLPKAPRRR